MIDMTEEATSALTRSYRLGLQVQSWLGGTLLAADVPVDSAGEESDRTLRVPERLTFRVPRTDRGESWSPVSADHPLAANGQRLRVQLGVGVAGTGYEWLQRGWYVITDTETTGDMVTVTAAGLLYLVEEARLVAPLQPTGTLVSALRALVEPALTVAVDGALTDRAVPSGINWDEDRLQAVLDLLDAWPAEAVVDPAGFLSVVPDVTPTAAVLELTDGVGGTVVRASGASTRDGVASVVVARGSASDGGLVQGVAWSTYDTTAFNPLPVPRFYESPLITTVAQANAAAAKILARLNRAASVEFTVECVPHPGLQVGDPVSITTGEYAGLLCTVEGLTLPYVASGGAMSLRLKAVT